MPLYDMRCPEGCGYYSDIICRIRERNTQICKSCGAYLIVVPTPIMTVGPMPSKPLTINQIGRSFNSNEEFRQYQRDNPDAVMQTPEEFGRHRDKVRNKVEASARRQGFRDL